MSLICNNVGGNLINKEETVIYETTISSKWSNGVMKNSYILRRCDLKMPSLDNICVMYFTLLSDSSGCLAIT